MRVIRRLGLAMDDLEEKFGRMTFNVVARNQDDHAKNIAFLMDKHGRWSLAPAFDVMYRYNLSGVWTSQHQMSMNGKRDHFELEDFRAVGNTVSMRRGRAEAIVAEVTDAVTAWQDYAADAGVEPGQAEQIVWAHRLDPNP